MFRKSIFIISIVALLGAAGTASADLVAWWTFDDGSGTTAIDSSGNGNDGTLTGGATWVDGQLGGAIQFNGTNSYVAAPHIPFDNQSFTIAMWVNPVLYTDQQVVFGQVQTGSLNLSMHFRLGGPGGTAPVPGAVRMGFYSNDLNTVGGLLLDNNWYHLTFWYDFENQVRRIYVDGVQQAEDTGAPYQGASGETRIGQWNNNQWFRGIIDDVQIYNEPLTDAEIQTAMRGLEGLPHASRPNPEDGALVEQTWVTMGWRAGDFAVSQDVYLGDSFEDVNAGAEAAFRGNKPVTDTMLIAGFVGFPYPDGLVPGTTYYWRIDEVNDADPNSPWRGDVWSFTVPPRTAYDPIPADNARYVFHDATLSWSPGFSAKLHTVYFGDDFDTVANATGGPPQGGITFDPGPLEGDTIYYWRVDELDPPNTEKGDVWSFRTLPNIPVTDPNLVGWWKFDEGIGTAAFDWSGYGNHAALKGGPQWVIGQVGGALEFDGSDSYVAAPHIPLNSRSFTIAMWINPVLYTNEQVFFGQHESGSSDLSMHFRLGGPNIGGGNVPPRGVRMGFYSNDLDTPGELIEDDTWYHIAFWYDFENQTRRIYVDGVQQAEDAATPYLGTSGETRIGQWNNSQWYRGMIDDVRIYNRALTPEEIADAMRGEPDLAWGPSPANGSTPDVTAVPPLTWSAGDFASQHDVYLGTDRDAVDSADDSDTTGIHRGRQTATSYTPSEGIEWGSGPYFWRIDEYNADGTISKGRIWTFTVADFLLVDDFEGYTDNDAANEAIWQHWLDGFGVSTNGSQTGYTLPPYSEHTIVHGGGQSMPMQYNNTAGVTNSQVELKLASSRNWAAEGVGELSIWFQGQPASTGSFAEAPVGTFTMTGSGVDIWGTADQFHFAYKTLTGAGSIVARVVSIEETNVWAKAGVMIRETLETGSKNAMIAVTPGNGVSSQWRTDADTASSNAAEGGITAPHWVKLERDLAGNFTVSRSTNGTTWVPVANAIPQNIQMGGTVFIGLAVTSHDAALTTEAVLSNVTISGNVTGQWMSQDIGVASNAAEPLYVAVSNATGAPVVVTHPDPGAANVDTWTEWVIPLSEFSGKGINLGNVDKIAIGLGSGSGTAGPGGSGVMYIDDIRLYQPRP